jgi:hypothetical protein
MFYGPVRGWLVLGTNSFAQLFSFRRQGRLTRIYVCRSKLSSVFGVYPGHILQALATFFDETSSDRERVDKEPQFV